MHSWSPGDIVEIADPARMEVRGGGRVTIYTHSGRYFVQVRIIDLRTIRAPIPGWLFQVILEDGTLHSSTLVEAPPAPGTVLEVVDASPRHRPLEGHVFMLSEATLARYRVLTITEGDPGQYEVLAVEHDPDKRARVEDLDDQGTELTVITQGSALAAPEIDSVTAYENTDETWRVEITFTTNDAEAYWVDIRALNGGTVFYASTRAEDEFGVIQIPSDYGPPEETYTIRIQTFTYDRLRNSGAGWHDPTPVDVGNPS